MARQSFLKQREVQQFLKLGKKNGFVTREEFNNAFPQAYFKKEQKAILATYLLENNIKIHSNVAFIRKDGKLNGKKRGESKTYKLFVSKPNLLSPRQERVWKVLFAKLELRGLTPKTLNETEYDNDLPFPAARKLLKTCDGILVLGLKQTRIKSGVHRYGTKDSIKITDEYLSTPWNQIEAGMAFMLDMPVRFFAEKGVTQGVFEKGNHNYMIHQHKLTSTFLDGERLEKLLSDFYLEIAKYHGSKGRKNIV